MKTINRPTLNSATELTASDLNAIHFSVKKTKLTPQLLEKARKSGVKVN